MKVMKGRINAEPMILLNRYPNISMTALALNFMSLLVGIQSISLEARLTEYAMLLSAIFNVKIISGIGDMINTAVVIRLIMGRTKSPVRIPIKRWMGEVNTSMMVRLAIFIHMKKRPKKLVLASIEEKVFSTTLLN